VPKLKGFNNPFRVEYQGINLDTIAELVGLDEVTPDAARQGPRPQGCLVKVLGRGELTRPVTVQAHAVSKSAEAAITAAGGSGRAPARCRGARPVARRPRATSSPTADRARVRRYGRPAPRPAIPRPDEPGAHVLSSLKNMFKVADLRNKILFTSVHHPAVPVRGGDPVPGIDLDAITSCESARQGGVLGFLQPVLRRRAHELRDLRARDHAVHHRSIIMQVLTVVIPKLEEWQQQGAVGQRKITQWTRYLTIGHRGAAGHGSSPSCSAPAVAGAFFSAGQAPRSLDLPDGHLAAWLLIVPTLTAGTALLMWMGELITQRGIGNGMSLLIFASVVSACRRRAARAERNKGFWFVDACCPRHHRGIVFVEQGQRRIPVQFAKRVVGRRMYGGQSTYIPLKVNQSGVIPIIFASSVLYLPVCWPGPARQRPRAGGPRPAWVDVQPEQPNIVYV
jgi:hypothetical protein